MKTKQLCLLLLSMMLFAACEKTSLSAPANLQGYTSGDKIVLTWNGVNGASYYEVAKHVNGGGTQRWTVYNTNHTDYNPDNGINSYEVRAVSQSGQYSTSAYTTVFYEGNGGNGGGTNPGDNTVSITKNNLSGYWHGKTEKISGGSTSSYGDYYINLSSTGIWERVHVISSAKCAVIYGTWSLSGSTIYVQVEGENDFENGNCTARYSGTSRTDIYGVESLTNNTMSYTTGTYPYLKSYEFERAYSIPVSYKHNSDL